MKKYILSGIVVILSGCATPPSVILSNPATGQIVACSATNDNVFVGGAFGYAISQNNIDNCIKTHVANGFKVNKY